MHYLIGDVQGCCDALDRLLAEIGFSPSRDRIYVLGDLVNRGPRSLATLRRLRGLGDSATCLLGNHDLHLLAVAHGVRPAHASDTLDEILGAPDREAWLDWLRSRRMAVQRARLADGACRRRRRNGTWRLTLALAGEVEAHAARATALRRLPARDVRQRAGALGRRRCTAPTAALQRSTC